MARTGKNNLRRWEFPAGSGIIVREIINRWQGSDRGLSYRVTIPSRLAGARLYKQFSTAEGAETWVKEQHDGVKKSGQKHFLLTPGQREDATAELALLQGTGLTLGQAAAFAKKHSRSVAGSLTVQEVIDRLLAEKTAENLRECSVRDLRNRLTIFAQTFGEQLVKEISQTAIEHWLRDLRGISDRSASGLSKHSKKNYLITVRTFFNYAIAKGYRAAENPATKISTPKIDWEVPSILTVAEAEKLLTSAQTEQKGRLLASVVLGLFAGIRSNEITRLDRSAIDLDEGILTIGPQIAKKRRLRVLELMPNCVA